MQQRLPLTTSQPIISYKWMLLPNDVNAYQVYFKSIITKTILVSFFVYHATPNAFANVVKKHGISRIVFLLTPCRSCSPVTTFDHFRPKCIMQQQVVVVSSKQGSTLMEAQVRLGTVAMTKTFDDRLWATGGANINSLSRLIVGGKNKAQRLVVRPCQR